MRRIRLPLWAKIALVLTVALMLPLLPALLSAENRAREFGERAIGDYMRDISELARAQIESNFQTAQTQLITLVETPGFRDLIEAVFTDNSAANVEALNMAMRAWLVNNTWFTQLHVASVDSSVFLASTSPEAVLNPPPSDSFLSLTEVAELLNDPHRMEISVLQGSPTIELAQLVRSDTGGVLAFVKADVNPETLLYPTLPYIEDTLVGQVVNTGLFSAYLVTGGGQIFAPEDRIGTFTRLAEDVAIPRAQRQESGVEAFQLVDGTGLVYFTPINPIRDTNLVLIMESTLSTQDSLILRLLGAGVLLLPLAVLTMIAGLTGIINLFIALPARRMRRAVSDMVRGDFAGSLSMVRTSDLLGRLADELDNLRSLVRETVAELEQRITQRGRDIEATQSVARALAAQQELQPMMDEVVNLIVREFPNLYHAQIFLIDGDRRYAVLRASTGDPGQRLLERGHRLAVGSISVIGQVTQEGRTIAAVDTATSEVHRRNEFLPDTRAELAIPLRVGDEVFGALDVQSKQSNTFTEDQITVLEIMADQIAVSIQNARLYQDFLRRIQEVQEENRDKTYNAWAEHLSSQQTQALVYEVGTSTTTDMSQMRQQALFTGRTQIGERSPTGTRPVTIPIQLRGQVLGTMECELPDIDFSGESVQLAEELVSRLSISLDNARLFQQSQRTAERERVVNTIATQLTSQTDVDNILQTAVREVGRALRAPEVRIRLHMHNGAGRSAEEMSFGGNGASDNGGSGHTTIGNGGSTGGISGESSRLDEDFGSGSDRNSSE